MLAKMNKFMDHVWVSETENGDKEISIEECIMKNGSAETQHESWIVSSILPTFGLCSFRILVALLQNRFHVYSHTLKCLGFLRFFEKTWPSTKFIVPTDERHSIYCCHRQLFLNKAKTNCGLSEKITSPTFLIVCLLFSWPNIIKAVDG